MAIEFRNGRAYVYTSQRYGTTVRKVYRGAGKLFVAHFNLVQAERNIEHSSKTFERIDTERKQKTNARLREWIGRVNAVVAEAMNAAGWHQHKREWRRKRGATMGTLVANNGIRGTWVGTDLRTAAGELPPDLEAKAAKGDKSVLPAIDEFLQNPAAVQLWGDVGRQVLVKLAHKYADGLAHQQAFVRFASDLRARLAGENPSALETLLAERVVLSWAFLNWADAVYLASCDKLTLKQSEFQVKRIEMANRNLMTAAKTLAKVQRRNVPDVLALVNVNSFPPKASQEPDSSASP